MGHSINNLVSKGKVKEILKSHSIRPSKRLGQNFLISQKALSKVIEAAELQPEDIVLEVGAGLGALTFALARRVKQVVAVEKDKRLVKILNDALQTQEIKNIKVVNVDILKLTQNVILSEARPNFAKQNFGGQGEESPYKTQGFFGLRPQNDLAKKYKLVGNLPYNIATAVVMKFLQAANAPELMAVMLQKEVGQRMCAKQAKMTKLGIFCQFYSQPQIVHYVSKRAFWPQAKVDSAILRIIPRTPTNIKLINTNLFAQIVKAGFSYPRKQLVNNLSKSKELNWFKIGRSAQLEPGKNHGRKQVEKWLWQNNIKPSQRAETLSLNNWLNLARTFPK